MVAPRPPPRACAVGGRVPDLLRAARRLQLDPLPRQGLGRLALPRARPPPDVRRVRVGAAVAGAVDAPPRRRARRPRPRHRRRVPHPPLRGVVHRRVRVHRADRRRALPQPLLVRHARRGAARPAPHRPPLVGRRSRPAGSRRRRPCRSARCGRCGPRSPSSTASPAWPSGTPTGSCGPSRCGSGWPITATSRSWARCWTSRGSPMPPAGRAWRSTAAWWRCCCGAGPGRSRSVAVVGFHLVTGMLFPIGVFPWVMIAGALVFFPPDWPGRLAAHLGRRTTPAGVGPMPVSVVARDRRRSASDGSR